MLTLTYANLWKIYGKRNIRRKGVGVCNDVRDKEPRKGCTKVKEVSIEVYTGEKDEKESTFLRKGGCLFAI